jgi:hypothetical protein
MLHGRHGVGGQGVHAEDTMPRGKPWRRNGTCVRSGLPCICASCSSAPNMAMLPALQPCLEVVNGAEISFSDHGIRDPPRFFFFSFDAVNHTHTPRH